MRLLPVEAIDRATIQAKAAILIFRASSQPDISAIRIGYIIRLSLTELVRSDDLTDMLFTHKNHRVVMHAIGYE